MRKRLVLTVLAGAALLLSATHEKSAGPGAINFIRPGLVMKVTGASIAADGTIKAKVKLTDPKGLPLDRVGVTTPGSVSVSLIAAYIPQGQTQYTSYTTRCQTSPITGVTAQQAGADSGGVWTTLAEGEYEYTFKTRAPKGFDTAATHTIGIYGSRSLTEFDMGTQYDDDFFHFVPDGSKVTAVRDVIRMGSCNACHHDQGFHGGSRRSMEICVLCHQPQTVDPDTGNTMDMPVMTHKIHAGATLDSVKAGGKYQIIGHGQTVADFSKVVFPGDVRNCSICHQAGPAQAENVFKPNRAACGACHDDGQFRDRRQSPRPAATLGQSVRQLPQPGGRVGVRRLHHRRPHHSAFLQNTAGRGVRTDFRGRRGAGQEPDRDLQHQGQGRQPDQHQQYGAVEPGSGRTELRLQLLRLGETP